MHSQSN
jgi:hypothetical protein